MNILGFVTGLLMIFAISSHVLWEKRISQEKIDLSYQGYLEASRQVQNQWESKKFQQIKNTEKKKDAPTSTTKKTDKEKKPPQISFSPECAKINLYFLLKADKETEKELYSLVLNLLSSQYEEKKFFQPISEKQPTKVLLDEILFAGKKALKADKGPLYLEKLQLKTPEYQQVYYHMLKGTKNYSDRKMEGYPSLLNLLKVEMLTEKEKICLSCAPLAVLEVLFPKKVASDIYLERQEKKLSQEDLDKIFSKHHHLPSPTIQEMVQIIHPKKKKKNALTLSGKNRDANISIERKFHISG